MEWSRKSLFNVIYIALALFTSFWTEILATIVGNLIVQSLEQVKIISISITRQRKPISEVSSQAWYPNNSL